MLLRNPHLFGRAASIAPNIAPTTRDPGGGILSPYAFAMDITNGLILYSRAGSEVYDRPASTVKAMTALLLGEIKGGSMSETVTWQTSDDLASGFSQVGLTNGDVVTWTDLLHGILMVSGGDACQAAARVIGNEDAGNALDSTDGYARFVEMMNERALDLGCRDVHYSNAHGAERNWITARDSAIIAGACFSNAVVAAMALTTSYALNVTGANARTINLNNGNPLLDDTGVKGSKTGSLAESGLPDTYSLVTLWTAPSGDDIALCNMGTTSSAERYNDTTEMIASLPTDFPYLAA